MRAWRTVGAAALAVAALLAPLTAPADAGGGHHLGREATRQVAASRRLS